MLIGVFPYTNRLTHYMKLYLIRKQCSIIPLHLMKNEPEDGSHGTWNEKYGFGLWAVVLKETGAFIGDCGIFIQNIDGEMLPEIGYHIHKRY